MQNHSEIILRYLSSSRPAISSYQVHHQEEKDVETEQDPWRWKIAILVGV